jgi:hypothetical protein
MGLDRRTRIFWCGNDRRCRQTQAESEKEMRSMAAPASERCHVVFPLNENPVLRPRAASETLVATIKRESMTQLDVDVD